MANINRIVVTLEPYNLARYEKLTDHILDIRVDIFGKRSVFFKEFIPDNDFVSRFDYLMDYAKDRIRREMEKGGGEDNGPKKAEG